MAVRFDATGEEYTATLSAGSQSAFTFAAWAKISVDRNAFGAFLSLGASGADRADQQIDSNGTDVYLNQSAASTTAIVLTAGTWYYIAAAVNGANGTLYVRSDVATTWTTATYSTGTNVTCTTLKIGVSLGSATWWLNGCIAAIKVWIGATLTQAELDAEMWQYMPARTANLSAWYPLITPETADYSGNGQTLSGGVGAAQEDGPGIAWRAAPVFRPYLPLVPPPPWPPEGDAGIVPVVTQAWTAA